MEKALKGAVNVGVACKEALAGLGKGPPGIVAEDRRVEQSDLLLLLSKLAIKSGFLTRTKVIQTLGCAAEECGNSIFGATDGQTGEALLCLQNLKTDCAVKTVGLVGQMFGNLVLGFCNQLGCGRRSRRAKVGCEVGDGEVGLVADGRDDWQA